MSERWRERLGTLDAIEPSHDVWQRATTRSTDTFSDLPSGRGHRVVALVVAVVLAATGLVGVSIAFGRGPGIETPGPSSNGVGAVVHYRDPTGTWSISFPRSFHAEPAVPEDGLAAHEVWIANVALPPGGSLGPSLPSNAVVILITYGHTPRGLREFIRHDVSSPDSTFPISLEDLQVNPGSASIQSTSVIANGQPYFISVHIGLGVSPQVRGTVGDILGSLRFLPLKKGAFISGPPDFRVLGYASEYSEGSVTDFSHTSLSAQPNDGPGAVAFDLVHTRRGIYALGWVYGAILGYRNCDVTYDVAARQFTCPNGARWALDGSVVATPAPALSGEPLIPLLTRISLDGHVLVAPLQVPLRYDLRLTGGA